jgi:class 3 adenylate cyclase
LRIGIGVHTGPSILGEVGPLDRGSLQFLGDTGNVAARLNSQTKDMGCVALISAATWHASGRAADVDKLAFVEVRGRGEVAAVAVTDLRDLT